MKKTCVSILGAALLLAVGFAVAEESGEDSAKQALKHIDQGREALVAGDAAAAIDHLQKAIGLIQQGMEKKLESFLPAAPAGSGLVKGDVDSSSGSWGSGDSAFQTTSVTCTYSAEAEDDDRELTVQISNSPQLIESVKAMVQMYDNEEFRKMVAMNPDVKIESVEGGGFKGWLIATRDESTQIMAVSGKIMVQINLNRDDPALVKSLWSAMDREGLAK